MRSMRLAMILTTVMLAPWLAPGTIHADEPGNGAFLRTWQRTDRPVVEGKVSRTWMWGPEADSPQLSESYAEGPAGARVVQYYDKSRMEISTDPNADPNGIWYVTNGLLVEEMVTGRMQVGDGEFEDRAPAWINVAGDENDPLGPSYATFATLLNAPPTPEGAVITNRVNRYGIVSDDPALTRYGIGEVYRVTAPGIDHTIAGPFWEFMNSAGTIFDQGSFQEGALFVNPFYATGYPISEAYWADVAVAGVRVDVLIQCFERRCLTYTPANPDGWKVEAGNVGRHYYAWRYLDWPGAVPVPGARIYAADLSNFAPFSAAVGNGAWSGSSYTIDAAGGSGAASIELVVHATNDDYVPPATGEIDSLDVRISSGGPDVFACLVSRISSDDSGTRRYALCIDGYGTVSAVFEAYAPDGGLLEYQPLLEFTASSAVAPPGAWNTLQIAVVDSRFWFLVNGDLVGTAGHQGASSGLAGFYLVNDSDAPASAEFRNLSVDTAVER